MADPALELRHGGGRRTDYWSGRRSLEPSQGPQVPPPGYIDPHLLRYSSPLAQMVEAGHQTQSAPEHEILPGDMQLIRRAVRQLNADRAVIMQVQRHLASTSEWKVVPTGDYDLHTARAVYDAENGFVDIVLRLTRPPC